jgi:hypothetical protein
MGAGGMAQVEESLQSKYKVQCSKPNTAKKKKNLSKDPE